MLLPIGLSVSASENLLCNPGFDDGPVGWFGDTAIPCWNIWGTDGWHCSDSDLPIYYYHNTRSITQWWNDCGVYQDFAVAEGTGYSFSVNAITPSCEPLCLWKGDFRVEWHDSDWNEISSETIGQFTDADTVDVWKCISGGKMAPVGAVNGRVVLALENWQNGVSGKLYWDDVNVSVMNTVTAWNPIPSDAAEHVSDSVVLKWLPGKDVVSHDVYFDSSYDDVNNAGTSSSVYEGNREPNNYCPGILTVGQTYYWRIDEVNDAHPDSPWKGDVWSFTVQTNSLLNSGFENNGGTPGGPADWWANTEEAGIENWAAHNGSWGMAIVTWNGDGTGEVYQDIDVSPGESYTYAIWTLRDPNPLSGNFYMKIQWYNGETSLGENLQNITIPSDSWVQQTLEATSPAGSDTARVIFGSVNIDRVGKFDDASFSGPAPIIANNPSPADEATGVNSYADLIWSAGRKAASHDVYLGTDFNDVNQATANWLVGDVNSDGQVDWGDISILAEQWLTIPDGSPSADIAGGNSVNLLDFAVMVNDWVKNSAFKGNQPETRFDPGIMDFNTTYYWRIDEVNGPNTWKGDVWNFATGGPITLNQSYGINIHAPQAPHLDYLLDEVVACKLGWVRVDFNWNLIETSQDDFDWSVHDALVAAANARGLHIFATLAYTPDWATSGAELYGPPDNSADWYDFCYQAALRYKGSVEHWGMWNEPDLAWQGTRQQYIDIILINGADAVHAANPDAKVCGPELAQWNHEWYYWLKESIEQAGDKLDIVTHHAYAENTGQYPEVTEMLEATTQYGDNPNMWNVVEPSAKEVLEYTGWFNTGKPFWFTETGLQSNNLSESDQADYYEGLLNDWFSGIESRDWMDKVFFYELRDSVYWREYWGILGTADENFYRKRAFFVYQNSPYLDPNQPIDVRVETLLAEMTLEEKIAQMGGDETAMSTPDNDRLGIPGLKMADGPHGVRWEQATCFPGALALGATWDTAIIQQVGEALGREFRGKGRYVALGPCINIIRDPRGGRSFETFGEDPYLVGQLASAYVEGVQSEKVIAVVKHLACNNQEDGRGDNNIIVNERTLREIYMPAFKTCVQDANALGIMSAYNKVNVPYCSENTHLLSNILKDEWGFEGFVVSDWGACHSTIESANAGLNVEMPYSYYFGQPLLDAVAAGQVLEETIDKAVRGILWTKFWSGVFEEPVEPNENAINTPEHQALTLEAAKKSIVLLKNAGAKLPLDKTAITTIAVIGPNADIARYCGGGSCYVTPYYKVSPLEGIQDELSGSGVTVNFSQGCHVSSEDALYTIQSSVLKPPDGALGDGLQGEYFNNKNLEGTPALTRIDALVDFGWWTGSPAPEINTDNFSVKWTGKLVPEETGQYTLGTESDDGVRLYLDGELLINDWNDHPIKINMATIALNAGQEYDIQFEYYENAADAIARLCWVEPSNSEEGMIAEAVSVAADANVVVVFVGTTALIEAESWDRDHLDLPGSQDALIAAVTAANPNTVVAVVSGSAVLMNDWLNDVPAVLQCWFNGQETGNAIADVLFGDRNPAGRLPISFPLTEEQLPPFDNNYEAAGEGPGYRYYDRQQIEPLFPFGHGLSYTQFEYSNLQITPAAIPSNGQVSISVDVTNVGNRQGDEVVQLYVHDVNASVVTSVKELKGFERISLESAQTKTVTFILPAEKLAFYDVGQEKFIVEPGMFEIMIGASSKDIRAEGSFEVE